MNTVISQWVHNSKLLLCIFILYILHSEECITFTRSRVTIKIQLRTKLYFIQNKSVKNEMFQPLGTTHLLQNTEHSLRRDLRMEGQHREELHRVYSPLLAGEELESG